MAELERFTSTFSFWVCWCEICLAFFIYFPARLLLCKLTGAEKTPLAVSLYGAAIFYSFFLLQPSVFLGIQLGLNYHFVNIFSGFGMLGWFGRICLWWIDRGDRLYEEKHCLEMNLPLKPSAEAPWFLELWLVLGSCGIVAGTAMLLRVYQGIKFAFEFPGPVTRLLHYVA